MSELAFAELSFDGGSVTLPGRLGPQGGLCVSDAGIRGWHGTPDAKVEMSEMQTGDGAHAVEPGRVLYSARTVTVGWHAVGRSRDESLSLASGLLAAAHRIVELRVVDGGADTFVRGYAQVEVDAGVRTDAMSGTLTVVCPDPRRYSTTPRRAMLLPGSAAPGGLSYGPGAGLAYPLSYGEAGPTAAATLVNDGTSTAYPVITVTGPVSAGLRLDHDGGSLSYGGEVGAAPLVLDSLSRTARLGGADSSRLLASRGFPAIPPGGSITLSAAMVGEGWAAVEWRDTYI